MYHSPVCARRVLYVSRYLTAEFPRICLPNGIVSGEVVRFTAWLHLETFEKERERERSNRLDFNVFSVLLLSKPFDIIVSETRTKFSGLLRGG